MPVLGAKAFLAPIPVVPTRHVASDRGVMEQGNGSGALAKNMCPIVEPVQGPLTKSIRG